MAFNTAIAAMIEMVNAATGRGLTRDQMERFIVVMSPFAPHLAEEIWSRLGHDGLIAEAAWPEADASLIAADVLELPVQIQGKVRSRITVPAEATEAEVREIALGDERVQELLAGKTLRKVIVVPGKIVNIIAS